MYVHVCAHLKVYVHKCAMRACKYCEVCVCVCVCVSVCVSITHESYVM